MNLINSTPIQVNPSLAAYTAEKEIEAVIEAEIQSIIDSGRMWFPHNMAFGIRQALSVKGYKIKKRDNDDKSR